jgi:hypothetical protein
MSFYYQETNSRTVIAFPPAFTYSLVNALIDETVGEISDPRSFSSTRGFRIIERALDAVLKLQNSVISGPARQILGVISDCLLAFQNQGVELYHLPPLRTATFDDGSFLIEWVFEDFRIGFTFELEPTESGWYLVSNQRMGYINASGYMNNVNMKKTISWLIEYTITNS